MEIKVGQAYRDRTGTLFQVYYYTEEKFQAVVLNPNTKEPTDYIISGEGRKLHKLIKSTGAKIIDLNAYIPTGLVNAKDKSGS